MADILENLDSKVLLYLGSAISLLNSAFKVAPSYNFPLYLFSIYAYERENSNESLKYATGLFSASLVMDFVWLLVTRGQHGFSKALSIILLILKTPTTLALLNHLRTRGAGFSLGETGSLSAGNTIWSMPGGFGSGAGGYQAVGGDREDELETGRPAQPRVPQPHYSGPNSAPAPARPGPQTPLNTGP